MEFHTTNPEYNRKMNEWALKYPLTALVLFGNLSSEELEREIRLLGY